jgi:hypothetical protein
MLQVSLNRVQLHQTDSSGLLLNDDSCIHGSHHWNGLNDRLREPLALEVDATSGERLEEKLKPFSSPARLAEELAFDAAVADRLRDERIAVAHLNLHLMLHVRDFKLKELQGPLGLSAAALAHI